VETIQIAGFLGLGLIFTGTYNLATLVGLHGTPDALQPAVVAQGANSGDGTVPLWSAALPGATMYYVRLPHDRLQRDPQVLQAVLDLAHGGKADLPQKMEPGRGPVIAARPTITDPDAEAARLREAIEAGRVTADDVALLRLAF
jgi:hypothetical protein